jgi:hypothetical protein
LGLPVDEVEGLLPVGPWTLAAVATVLVVALSVPPGGPRPTTVLAGRSPLVGPVGLLLAVLVVVAARLGPDTALRNPVPILVVGLGWPLLLLLPALVGLLLGRPDEPDVHRADAWPAVLPALALAGFLVVPVDPTAPDLLATAVGAYALAVLAAAVALGRDPVAARVELLGLLAAWSAVGRVLPRWCAPRGALAVLAVVLATAWFERFERSAAWTAQLPARSDTVVGLAVAVAAALLGAALLHLATRTGGPGTAAAVLLPLAVGTVVAGVARRALISVQLLLDQVADRGVDPDPLGIVGGQLLALTLVVLGGAAAAAVLARRMGEETARLPGVVVLLALTAVSAVIVLQP